MRVGKVISGGQTGADRGGLDAALALGIPHLAIVPRGRRAEDGIVPIRYQAKETHSSNYLTRTRLCVEHADATIIFTWGEFTPGSMRTLGFCTAANKSVLHVDVQRLVDPVEGENSYIHRIRKFLEDNQVAILNVAGSRESKAPGIQQAVCSLLTKALAP